MELIEPPVAKASIALEGFMFVLAKVRSSAGKLIEGIPIVMFLGPGHSENSCAHGTLDTKAYNRFPANQTLNP